MKVKFYSDSHDVVYTCVCDNGVNSYVGYAPICLKIADLKKGVSSESQRMRNQAKICDDLAKHMDKLTDHECRKNYIESLLDSVFSLVQGHCYGIPKVSPTKAMQNILADFLCPIKYVCILYGIQIGKNLADRCESDLHKRRVECYGHNGREVSIDVSAVVSMIGFIELAAYNYVLNMPQTTNPFLPEYEKERQSIEKAMKRKGRPVKTQKQKEDEKKKLAEDNRDLIHNELAGYVVEIGETNSYRFAPEKEKTVIYKKIADVFRKAGVNRWKALAPIFNCDGEKLKSAANRKKRN